MWGFATAAVVFATLLMVASLVVATLSSEALRPIRMTGPAVRRGSGYVLLIVGVWFAGLAILPSPVLGS